MALTDIVIDENIRYHKPNDPYYWEVDNLPLVDIMRNMVRIQEGINLAFDNLYDQTYIDDQDSALGTRIDNLQTISLTDVYDDGSANSNRVSGDFLIWDDNGGPPNVARYEQRNIELDDLKNVIVPKWYDGWTTQNPDGHRHGDMLMYQVPTGQLLGTYVNKQNSLENLTDVSANSVPTHLNSMMERKTGIDGEYQHKHSGQLHASRIVKFADYNKEPHPVATSNSSPTYTVTNALAYINASTSTDKPYITALIFETRFFSDGANGNFYVTEGAYNTSRLVTSGFGDDRSYQGAEYIFSCKNASQIVRFSISGFDKVRLVATGFVVTRRFRAILDD